MKRPVERVLDQTLRELEREDSAGLWLSSSRRFHFHNHFLSWGFLSPSWINDLSSPKRSFLARYKSLVVTLFNDVKRSIQRLWYRILFGHSRREAQQPEAAAKALEYRKGSGQTTWHFCPNCSNWPTTNYHSRIKATIGELCNECQAKLANGMCR